MEPLPTFPLFPDPLREKVFERSGAGCDLCGRARGWRYVAGAYHNTLDTDRVRICPWCIADGTAGARGFTFNDGTICPFFDTTPQLTRKDRDLVEQRTPGFVTWQGNHWLMCCGRACVYVGEAQKGDLRGRWAEAVASIVSDFEAAQVNRDVDELVDSIGHGSPCVRMFFSAKFARNCSAFGIVIRRPCSELERRR